VGGGGAYSYDCKKAWSSINHSMLSLSLHHLPLQIPTCLKMFDLTYCTVGLLHGTLSVRA
jgi:hypothetical protein